MKHSTFKTRTAIISFEKPDYIKVKILSGSIIDEEDALDNFLVIKNLSGGQKKLKLIDLRGKWEFTSKGKKATGKSTSAKTTIARAYIIDSFLTKLRMKFLVSAGEPKVPQMFFTDEKEAVSWLMTFKS